MITCGLIFVLLGETKPFNMKKTLITLFIPFAMIAFVSCNNEAGNDSDSDTTDNALNSTTSSGEYAAKAETFRVNSEAGKYKDVKTGQPIRISVDPSTGQKTNAETNAAVDRYIYVVDGTWWVYDENDNQETRAKLENDRVLFEDGDKWVEYDVKFKVDDDGTKLKTDNMKIKSDDEGSKMKTDDQKVKTDEDGTKRDN